MVLDPGLVEGGGGWAVMEGVYRAYVHHAYGLIIAYFREHHYRSLLIHAEHAY